jgi:hypothetical protein
VLVEAQAATGTFVPAPVAPPFTQICNLCSDSLIGANASTSDSTLPIAPGSKTTCGDVESIVQDLTRFEVSCGLILGTDLPGRCGCPTQAPSPAPVAYPSCSVCANAGEIITNTFGQINLNETSINPSIASQYFDCYNIEFYASNNAIQPEDCSQLHQAGISKLCGCQSFPVGPSTCQAASSLTLGETVLSSIANITTNTTNFKNKPCTIDSPGVWFQVEGTGGPLTVNTCGFFSNFDPKLSVFSGAACDELTCLGGNSDFACQYTFLSKSQQTYYVVVSGYYGGIGPFNLTLTDQTNPPTIAPSAYPTAPTPSPSRFPTQAPVPTFTSTQYPTTTLYPDCNICGSSDKRMSLPNVPVGPNGYACQDVELNGLTNQIEPSVCSVLTELNLAEKCGCITPTGNDVCDGAITVPLGQSLNGTTLNATWDNEQICPFDNFYSAGVWYKFVGTGDKLKIDTCQYSELFAELSVFKGSDCGSLQCVSTNAGFCGVGSRVTVNSEKGATYFVLVHGYSQGNFELSLADAIPPANDLCSNAASISPGQILSGTTNDATPDGLPSCGDDVNNTLTPGVWYHVKSNAEPSRLVADTCGSGTTFDTAISVFTGSCGNLECVAGNDNACYTSSRVVWESDAATDYFILVHGPGSSFSSNDFQLELTEVAATPTISPAPSIGIFRPCHCPPGVFCACFHEDPGTAQTGASGGASPVPAPGASPVSPAASAASPGGSSFPPPYAAPVASPISQAATSSPTPVSAPVVYTQSPTTYGNPYLSYQTTIQGGPKSPKGSKKFPGDQKGGKAKSPKQKRY